MNNEHNPRRRGLSLPVVLFFVFAILVIGAFLIVGLVKSCSSDEEQKREETVLEQNYAQDDAEEPTIQLPATGD